MDNYKSGLRDNTLLALVSSNNSGHCFLLDTRKGVLDIIQSAILPNQYGGQWTLPYNGYLHIPKYYQDTMMTPGDQ